LSVSSVSGTNYYGAGATFYGTPDGGASCTPGAAGTPCCYVVPGGGTAPTPASAGVITLTDSTTIGTLYFDAGVGYKALSSITTTTLKWAAGDAITINAAGDATDVAAFSGPVTAPAALAGITPTLSETMATDVTLASGFTVGWTAGNAGNVSVSLSDAKATGSISCLAPTSAATLAVPASLLANFNSGDTGYISVTPSVTAAPSTPSANASVTLEVTAAGGFGLADYK
jgi:hypothetical protein